MRVNDLLVEVRDRTLSRVAQIKPEHLDLTTTLVHNGPGKWRLRLPAEHASAGHLMEPGSGLIVNGPDGVLFSGPTSTPTVSATMTDPLGMVTIEGVTDDALLWRRLAYPTPTTADVTAQTSAYDVRSGVAETVMRAYVDANIGASAPAARKVAALTLAADGLHGPTVKASARFDTLGDLLTEIATFADLGFRLVQVGSSLVFEVFPVTDRTKTVRFDVNNGTLSSQDFAQSTPGLTRAIVAGQGEGALRTLVERTSADATAAEALWGVFGRVERFIDQRQTNDLAELQQAGDKALTEEGFTAVAVKAVASDDLTMRFAVDWDRGDKVTVVVDGQETSTTVTAVTLIADRSGVKVGASIGDVSGFSAADAIGKRVDGAAQRISALERTAEASKEFSASAITSGTLAPARLPVEGLRIPGEVIAYAATTAPTGWLVCDGSAVSRTAYPSLFAAIGTLWGAGNGSTTFNLPDFRGRFLAGAPAFASGYGVTGTGGEETHLLTAAEMPSHSHIQNAHGHTIWGRYATGGVSHEGLITGSGDAIIPSYGPVTSSGYAIDAATATNQNTGGGAAHNNLPPFKVINYVIKT